MRQRIVATAGVLALIVSLLWGVSSAAPSAHKSDSPVLKPASPAAILYSQPASASGGLLLSSLRDPDGSAADQWVWDAFVLSSAADISEIRWSGGYDPSRSGSGNAVNKFTVSIFASVLSVSEPDLSQPLLRYETRGNAGETPGALLGGVQMYDYAFMLPTAFHAQANTKYWVQIEAYQTGALPDWGLARASGGDGSHFQKIAGETQYRTLTGDTVFVLIGSPTRSNSSRLYVPILLR